MKIHTYKPHCGGVAGTSLTHCRSAASGGLVWLMDCLTCWPLSLGLGFLSWEISYSQGKRSLTQPSWKSSHLTPLHSWKAWDHLQGCGWQAGEGQWLFPLGHVYHPISKPINLQKRHFLKDWDRKKTVLRQESAIAILITGIKRNHPSSDCLVADTLDVS